ncbi:MAG: hypothetical protein IPM29_23535 [Planctomycetes bacterium]|nr:hypothetical protein [Planctomycetota bacterium]
MSSSRPLATALVTALLCGSGLAQDPDRPQSTPGGPPPGSPPALPQGMTEDQMWPVPTTADWAKPVLIQFQRTWADAVEVSRQTGKPILICINMDGEIASEHYAGIKYRDPEYAKLFDPYVCVIASVYRHTPRDHDEHGNRILCPRLGSVTCGEHIAIEPGLFERYMDGRRISPRHIMVELDGKETYDVYFAWDTQSVFDTIREGIDNRAITPPPYVRGDQSIVERVASRDIADRIAVEGAYREGDQAERRALLEAALQHPDAAPVDLLRLAVFGLDADLAAVARDALAKVDDTSAVDLVGEALGVPMDDGQRESLVQALERLAPSAPRARLLANVHRGLATESRSVDVARWSQAMSGGGTYAPPPDRNEIEARLAQREAAANGGGSPEQTAQAQLELAEASLALAVDPQTRESMRGDLRNGERYLRLMFEDARLQAQRAAAMGASGWRVESVLGLSAWYLGDGQDAYAHVIEAMQTMPAEPESWNAVATLALFAQARQEAIWDCLRNKTDWPREWMTDVNSAYAVLARHPLGTDQHAVTHYDFLDSLGAKGRAARVLQDGLERFPDSWKLHDRLRARILAVQGAAGLEPAYEAMLAKPGASPNLEWFAGLASIVTAEFDRRDGNQDAALAAYDRALTHYDRAIAANPDCRATADHYAALALAGKARIALQRDDLGGCLELILAALRRHPDATDDLDGLNISPAMTAKSLRATLAAGDHPDQLARLDAALAELDPQLLEVPEFERDLPDPRGRPRRGGRGR